MKQKKNRRNAAGPVITGTVAWVLSFLLVLLAVLGVVAGTVCNSRYLRNQVMESGFCTAALEQLNENYTSYGNAGGIPKEVMTAIVTEEQIRKDMFLAVESLYAGDRRLIAHPEVAEAAVEAIESNLEERGIQLTDEIRQAVQEMANGCQVDYDNYVQLIVTPYIAPYIARVTQMVWIGFAVLAVICVIALVLLMLLQPSGSARLRWCINAFSAAALFNAVVPLLFNAMVQMDRLNLKPEMLKMLVVSYTHGMVNVFFYAALSYAVVVAVLAIVWCMRRKTYRAVYRHTEEKQAESDA